VVRAGVLLLLGFAAWKVHGIRGRLAQDDSDPAATAALGASLASLPRQVGPYAGEEEPVAAAVVETAGADVYASIRYLDPAGRSFRLYIGGSIRNRENFHAPNYCMPAAGWETLEDSTVPFRAYPAANGEPTMRRLLLQYGSQRMIVYYWFQAGTRVANHEFAIRYFRFLDLLADEPLRPTLIVTLYMPVVGGIEETEEAAQEFLEALGPHLRSAILAEEKS
jgi:EpsI family protein